MIPDCLVVASHLRFDGVWQRPHHIVTRLAARIPTLFLEEPFVGATDRDEIVSISGNLSLLRPVRRLAREERIDAATVAATRLWIGERSPLLWFYTPMMLALADALTPAPIVYDCMDDLSAFDFAPAAMRDREIELRRRATVVFAGGESLFARFRDAGVRVFLEPSGVEFEHFAQARSHAPHALFARLERPACVYIGVVDERIDRAIVAALARRELETILVGPVVKIDPATLPQHPQIHFTGQIPYNDLPQFLAGASVAIMPFARNAATASISPTKTPEYLAAGVPVVTTPITDVLRTYGDVVTVAADPDAFAAACERVAYAPDRTQINAGIDRARTRSWDAIVARMTTALGRE